MIEARFFKDGEFDKVELQVVGDKSNVILKASADLVNRFPAAWKAYQTGTAVDHGGTSLMEIPGMDSSASMNLQFKGIHNAEALAKLSDGQVSALGNGIMTLRRSAQHLLIANEAALKNKSKAA